MIIKNEKLIVSFDKTVDAIAMESFCKKNNINGRLIPLPSQISEGCGLAWENDNLDKNKLIEILNNSQIKYDKMIILVL